MLRCKHVNGDGDRDCDNLRVNGHNMCEGHGGPPVVAKVPNDSTYSTKALAEAILSLPLQPLEREQLANELSEAICERDKTFSPAEFTKIIRGVKTA